MELGAELLSAVGGTGVRLHVPRAIFLLCRSRGGPVRDLGNWEEEPLIQKGWDISAARWREMKIKSTSRCGERIKGHRQKVPEALGSVRRLTGEMPRREMKAVVRQIYRSVCVSFSITGATTATYICDSGNAARSTITHTLIHSKARGKKLRKQSVAEQIHAPQRIIVGNFGVALSRGTGRRPRGLWVGVRNPRSNTKPAPQRRGNKARAQRDPASK
ncbi:hypothetical protein NDU88_006757 [Pleurodeles waltl]|uniref:Uncharacterized protein n=1 Tax=Pleurodeles waltl TaxID=8319 RepID=A0AAV7UMI8_PLEWA|nr:hypothetical protein NDU88_006757 [Pleurodeles waltl]